MRTKAEIAEFYSKSVNINNVRANKSTENAKTAQNTVNKEKLASHAAFFDRLDRIVEDLKAREAPVSDTDPNAAFRRKKVIDRLHDPRKQLLRSNEDEE